LTTYGQPGFTHSSTTCLPLKSASETVLPVASVAVKAGAGWPTVALDSAAVAASASVVATRVRASICMANSC
jgi:hypothetical protein